MPPRKKNATLAVTTTKTSPVVKRADLKFLVNSTRPKEQLTYTEPASLEWVLDAATVLSCLRQANEAIKVIHDASEEYDIDLFRLLGLRNLSALMGEVFARQVQKAYSEQLMGNPNQDGYPDLLALTPEGKQYIEARRRPDGSIESNKEHWSPYPHGGIEAKATCGDTAPAKTQRKPDIGDSRWIAGLTNISWKAHHQKTRRLLAVYWDFVEGLPTFLGVFWRNDLDTTIGAENPDWGSVVTPRPGSATTSVSIMKKSGVRKMGEGWLVLPREDAILSSLCDVLGVSKPTVYMVA